MAQLGRHGKSCNSGKPVEGNDMSQEMEMWKCLLARTTSVQVIRDRLSSEELIEQSPIETAEILLRMCGCSAKRAAKFARRLLERESYWRVFIKDLAED